MTDPKRKEPAYDPKCEELARWVLDDEYGTDYDKRLVGVLASMIQSAIDDWLQDREAQPLQQDL